MTQNEFDDLVMGLHKKAAEIASAKRPDYTQESKDVLQNFKDAARDSGITPMQAWLVHFQKQYSAVARHVKNPQGAPSESLESRFCDLLNYVGLGWGLLVDEKVPLQNRAIAKPDKTAGICRHCGKAIYYSPRDTVYLHAHRRYPCEGEPLGGKCAEPA